MRFPLAMRFIIYILFELMQVVCIPAVQALERDKDPGLAAARSPLRYPGKLAVDAVGKRLFISDSNNHRIVITTLDGDFIDQIGGEVLLPTWDIAIFVKRISTLLGVGTSLSENCLQSFNSGCQ